MMDNEQTKELRRIRITLICLLIGILITSGGTEVIYQDHHDNEDQYFDNLVSLGDGQFGVLSGNSSYDGGNTMTIYKYDLETNELKKINEVYLDELELE
ncbi:hypothetical protein [Bacillus sp. FJAT-50079]|uniref:hypothetical protein n=1 Tax=Bacillus sp. FJAT-50079 TaxID=2833577 RepID=UPI001BC92E87|nr:hypothetical protein [Bacillus sp. FJAT-50079]MBS4209290.1 hypothetical protein [Bacillus sp. FJAT-50079]